MSGRVWRLTYGPCWCSGPPTDTGAYDFIRMTTSTTELDIERNILIVSDRVLDGSRPMFMQLHHDVPEPRIVVAGAACPAARRFWDDLPMGWVPVHDLFAIDVHVDECVVGRPDALLIAVLNHLMADNATTAEGMSESEKLEPRRSRDSRVSGSVTSGHT